VKTAVIAACNLEYTPSDVTIFAGGDGDSQKLGTDGRVVTFLSQSADLAVRDTGGRVCLCVSAQDDEESELLLTHTRWPPTMATMLEATQPHPAKTVCLTPDDATVLASIAAHFAESRRLPFPTHRDDWLAQNNEEHESVSAMQRWIAEDSWKANDGAICILPIITEGDQPLPLEAIAAYAGAFFDRAVAVLPAVQLARPTGPSTLATLLGKNIPFRTRCEASDTEIPHGQFGSSQMLSALANRRVAIPGLPADYRSLLGITMSDLYIGDDDDFTQGLAQIGGGVGVFSFLRYTPEFAKGPSSKQTLAGKGNQKKGKGKAKTVESVGRVANLGAKTAVHEILHVFGLGHCTYAYCLMNGSGHLLEDFAIPHTSESSACA
jgi:predicted Zn-dependent protease